MTDFDRKKHWENIYETKQLDEVSWYQPTPTTSLEFIKENTNTLEDKIIDVGGGTGKYSEWLAKKGHHVHLIEPVKKHIEYAKNRAHKLKHKFSVRLVGNLVIVPNFVWVRIRFTWSFNSCIGRTVLQIYSSSIRLKTFSDVGSK